MTEINSLKPLEDLLVLDFSQFLSGPSASLRLADMGARVIKIERSGTGDICRTLYISNQELDGDSTLFHSINRNKESFAVDLKNPEELELIKKLIRKADVMMGNFRPGVMERLGLDYEQVKIINPQIIYGEISGYGDEGPWRDKPGQDLLVQSFSGLAWLNGDADQPPMPFGLAVADMMAGAQLAQGILACLVRRGITGEGALVQASLLEATLDFQFEVLSTYLNDGKQLPERSSVHNAHAYLGAPYGIYQTQNGYLALAMGSVIKLGELLACPELTTYTDSKEWSTKRDEIKQILVEHLQTATTEQWLSALEPADYWCADVLTWSRLMGHEGFTTLQMTQQVTRSNGASLMTTRCPIRMDGQLFTSTKGSPRIGEHNAAILEEIVGLG
ncbi:CoA transferase [Paenibacillus psychroresistens]|uniref:CoA transferase n=1 Tax=Paenibacillus psychroresistens TaxID=1778678 RepID=A0A6B8RH54_9BACL|nr:CaiB/BaiF CoA-transferase family protein [Paenibacillus psychroresistens]QGQ94716.1 CoA transferase [Paenibacillus psychroresistens]